MGRSKSSPLKYEYQGVFNPQTGLSFEEFSALKSRLESARTEVWEDVQLWNSGGQVSADKDPLDAGFIELPRKLLDEYRQNGPTSQVGRILAAARKLSEQVDRVVVLGIGGSYMGARALFEACCHPYHNELSRGERGGRPRIYFEGNNVDNDAVLGLFDLLTEKPVNQVEDAWGIVVISKSGGTLETAVTFRQALARLRVHCDGDARRTAARVVPVTGDSGRLHDLAKALGCADIFPIPDGVGGRFSIFSAVGLLPAALLGLDIVALLEGAAEMNELFRNEPPGSNPVLDYVGVSHLMEKKRGATLRILSTWGKGLEAAGFWYDQLLSESLGKEEHGATPITVVNTRDLHSRGQQHQQGRRDKLITNVIVDSCRREALSVGRSEFDQDQLNSLADKTLRDILAAAIEGTNLAYAEDLRPTVDLRLPGLDERTMGQFFQMMMLATVVEGRLIGVNPYGQPGVEGYKKHMNAILRGK